MLIIKIPIVNPHNPRYHFQRKDALLGTYSRSQASMPTIQHFRNLPYITKMSKIMRPSIENIVNVKGGGNWEFQVIAIHMGMDEEISCSCA